MSWRQRSVHIVGVALLIVVSTALALGLGEIVIRIVAPQQLIHYRPDIYQPTEGFGHRHVPNAHTTVNTGERDVRFNTDHEGFRVGKVGRREAETVIVFIGDSFLQAIQVEHEQSFAGLLEARLPNLIARPVAIRNTGVAGWDPNHYLLQTRRSLEREHPDLVVVFITVENDIIATRTEHFTPVKASLIKRFRMPRNLSPAELVNALLYPLNDYLESRSHLFILARRQAHTFRMRLGLSPLNLPPHYYRRTANFEMWDTTVAALKDVERVTSARGVPVFFVLLPSDYQVDSVSFNDYVRGFGLDSAAIDLELPNRRLNELMRNHGLHVIDALPPLRAAHASGTRLYGKVDPHLSPAGHEIIARVLAPEIVKYLRTDARSPAITASVFR